MTTLEESLDFNDLYNGHTDIIDEFFVLDNPPTDDLDYYTNDNVDYTDDLEDLYDLYDNQPDELPEQSDDIDDYVDEEQQTEPDDDSTSEELPDVEELDLNIDEFTLETDDLEDISYDRDIDSYPEYIDEPPTDIEDLISLESIPEEEPQEELVLEELEELENLEDIISELIEGMPPIDILPPPPPRVCKPKIEIAPVEVCLVETIEPNKCFREYNVSVDTVGYQLRGNNHTLPLSLKLYRYRLLFTSANGEKYVPANISQSVNAISIKKVNQVPINPFGEILYYCAINSVEVGSRPLANTLWTQCAVSLGYSFNTKGKKLNLTKWKPLYVRCTPLENGSAIIDDTIPYVQSLPSFADGKIYIYLGITYSETQIELDNNHVVYYNDGHGIRVWTGKDCYTKIEIDAALEGKQDVLISGLNIKTLNNETLLGSGNINIEGAEEINIDDIKELWKQYIIRK